MACLISAQEMLTSHPQWREAGSWDWMRSKSCSWVSASFGLLRPFVTASRWHFRHRICPGSDLWR